MREYRAKLGESGRFVIPATCRKALHFEPGEELILRVEKGELHVFSLKQSLKKAQSIVQHYAKQQSLVDKLHTLREEDK